MPLQRPDASSSSAPAAIAPPTGNGDASTNVLLILVAGAYLIAALAGLPLYADGGHYLFRIIVDGVPYVPDGRLAAVIPQLPAWFAARLDTGLAAIRLTFSVSYLLLPLVSLLTCWLILRRTAPWLMVLPATGALLNQINASGVSELLALIYLMWPLVLALSLEGHRRGVRSLVWLAGPLMVTLHPVSLLACLTLALAVWLTSRDLRLTIWLGICALARLVWSLMGLSGYEQSHLGGDGALWYLLTQTPGQHVMLVAVTLIGLAVALESGGRSERLPRWMPRVAASLLLVAAVLVGHELIWGQGWRLKSGITFVVQLGLMMAVTLSVPVANGRRGSTPLGSDIRWSSVRDAALFAIAALMLVKSAAWWTATRGLQNLVSEPGGPCIQQTRQAPFALQWPWMAPIDEWNAPMNALLFRPDFRPPGSENLAPIAVLLPRDGCARVTATGMAYMTPWLPVSWTRLEQHFGPLRPMIPNPPMERRAWIQAPKPTPRTGSGL